MGVCVALELQHKTAVGESGKGGGEVKRSTDMGGLRAKGRKEQKCAIVCEIPLL